MSRSLLVENNRTINGSEDNGINDTQYIVQKRNVPRTILANVTNNANILQEITMNKKIGIKGFSRLNSFFPLKDDITRPNDFSTSFNDSEEEKKREMFNNKENIPEYGYSEQRKEQQKHYLKDDSIHTSSTALSCNGLVYSENKSFSNQLEWQKKILKEDSKKKRPISTLVEQDEQKKFKIHEFTTEEEILEEYEWDDLDEEDCDDPLMVSEEVDDIFEYLHHLSLIHI